MKEKREAPMDTGALFEAFRSILERPGYTLERIPAEKKAGRNLCLKVNGKRGRAQLITTVRNPNAGSLNYARMIGPGTSADERFLIAVIDLGDGAPCFYVIPRTEAVALFREQGHSGRREGTNDKVFHIPHPPRPESVFTKYLDALHLIDS